MFDKSNNDADDVIVDVATLFPTQCWSNQYFSSVAFDKIIFHISSFSIAIAMLLSSYCHRRFFCMLLKLVMAVSARSGKNNDFVARLKVFGFMRELLKCVYWPPMINNFHHSTVVFAVFNVSFLAKKQTNARTFYASHIAHNSMLLSCIWKYLPTCVISTSLSSFVFSPKKHFEGRNHTFGIENL